MESSRIAARIVDREIFVLNALRHQWNHHTTMGSSKTPSTSAQRLAASMESSHACGVCRWVFLHVLNALRHQWNHHSAAPLRVGEQPCAQRLAASMESSQSSVAAPVRSKLRPATSRPRRCAQRLAASMESSRIAARIVDREISCSTPCGINGIITRQWALQKHRPLVLNALRHQWNHHTHVAFVDGYFCMCSTPCGINGIITRPPPLRVGKNAYINALRHQWNHHDVSTLLILLAN